MVRMKAPSRHIVLLGFAWLAITVAGAAVVLETEFEHERIEFVLEAQGLHRLVSQQMRQHAVLADTLATAPAATLRPDTGEATRVLRREGQGVWPAPLRRELSAAEARSADTGRPAAAVVDLPGGRYWMVRHAETGSVAIELGLAPLPVRGATEPFAGRQDVWARLEREGQYLPLLRSTVGQDDAGRWRFGFRQRLAQEDLGLDLVAVRRLGWAALPWRELAGWALLTSLLALASAAMILRGRAGPRPALGADTRPLTRRFVEADYRAAYGAEARSPFANRREQTASSTPLLVTLRELDVEPPELVVARGAIRQASRQARRTSAVIDGLRRKAEGGASDDTAIQPVEWDALVRDAADLLQLGCDRLGVACHVRVDGDACRVLADPMVLEQLVHRVFGQSLQALQGIPRADRRLDVHLQVEGSQAVLTVTDTAGPGGGRAADEATQRLAASIGAAITDVSSAQLGTTVRIVLPSA
jgi:hypothetical protein